MAKYKVTITWSSGHIEEQLCSDYSVKEAGPRLVLTLDGKPERFRGIMMNNILTYDAEVVG